jgi:diguanylate cyclase (GGDEF)-like protein
LDASKVGEKILHALNRPFELAGHNLKISSSIGVAVYPQHGKEEKRLVKSADIAMYHAKKAGRNNVKIYQPGMQEIIK